MTNDINVLKDAISGEFGLMSGMQQLSTALDNYSSMKKSHQTDICIVNVPAGSNLTGDVNLPSLTFSEDSDVHDILYFDCETKIRSHSDSVYMPIIHNELGYPVSFKMWVSVPCDNNLITNEFSPGMKNWWFLDCLQIEDPDTQDAMILTKIKSSTLNVSIYQRSGLLKVNMDHTHQFDYSHSHDSSESVTSLSGFTGVDAFVSATETTPSKNYGWIDLFLQFGEGSTGWFYWMFDVLVLKNSRTIFTLEDICVSENKKLIDSTMI